MNTKSLISASLVTATLIFSTTPAFAQGVGMQRLINQENRAEAVASRSSQRQENNLSNLIQRANKAIDNRVNELNKLSSRIQNDARLSADEKSSISANIQSDISGLTSLKAKIDADTDINVARTDVKSITNFKIYAVVVPQARILIVIDNLSSLNTRLQGLTPKLQDLINNLKIQGKDTASLQSLLDDINSQLSAISTKLSSDKSTVLGITPTSSNPQATFVLVRQDLAAVRQDFAKVRSDIGQMRGDFKVLINNTTGGSTSSPSASPTNSP